MGIDLNLSRRDKTKRVKYYQRQYVDNMKLTPNAQVAGVFYASDKDVFTTQTISVGNIKKTQTTGIIITHDVVYAMQVDDFVLYDGSLYVIADIVRSDETSHKEFSSRPKTVTEIRLRK